MARGSVITDNDDELEDDPFDNELEDGDDDEEVEEEEESTESEDEDDGETETPNPAQLQAQIQELTNRLGGLQGSLQRSQEEKQQMQMQFLGQQAQLRHAQLLAGGVEPAAAEAQVRAEVSQAVLQIQGNSINTEKQALEEASRIVTANHLAVKHGIPIDSAEFKRLALVKDPDDMAAMAELIATKKRTVQKVKQKAVRQKNQADKFGSARPAATPRKKKAGSLDEALEQFVSTRIRS